MKLSGIIKSYKSFVYDRLFPVFNFQDETISQWQHKFFADIMLFLLPFSIIIIIPSLYMCFHTRLYDLAVYDSLAFLIVQYIGLSKKLSITTRKSIFIIVLYLLGIVLISIMGWGGPGLIYILGVSVLSVILISKKAGNATFILNILVYCILATLSGFNLTNNLFIFKLTPQAIIIIGLNFLLFNFLLNISIISLITGLNNKIQSEKEIQHDLELETAMHLEAKKKAEESDRLKTAFLHNISHEIRTPLNEIVGFAYLLGHDDYDQTIIKEYASNIHKSSDRLIDLINNVIEISKIQTGQVEYQFTQFSANSILADLYSFFNSQSIEKKISLNYYYPLNDKDSIIFTDETKLFQIFKHLIHNSLKFTNIGRVEYGYEINGSDIVFYVSDTGIGITNELKELIFKPFIQIDNSLNRGFEGAGIGLSIAKGFTELLGGKIWFESQLNQGTTFYFTINTKQT